MILLRAILAVLSFIILVMIEFLPDKYIPQSLIFRFSPIFLLLVWLLISAFGRRKQTIKLKPMTLSFAKLIKALYTLFFLFVITGALLKTLRINYSQYFIIAGLGFFSVWSLIINKFAIPTRTEDPDILDLETNDDEEINED